MIIRSIRPTVDVTASVIRSDDKILIARRVPRKDMGGYWELAGGKVEPSETPEEGLKRELQEEFGIDVEIGRHIGENTHQYEEVMVRLIAYEVKYIDGEFTLVDHDSILWIRPEDIVKYRLAPADIPLIDKIIDSKFVE